MQTKLTLRIEDRLIRRAKSTARKRGKSVSELVSGYFEFLGDEAMQDEEPLPPLTRRLRGSLRRSGEDEVDYRRHLERKYR